MLLCGKLNCLVSLFLFALSFFVLSHLDKLFLSNFFHFSGSPVCCNEVSALASKIIKFNFSPCILNGRSHKLGASLVAAV